jgi:hypothetical protein
MVSSCSRAVLWSTCPTVGVENPASILESVRPPKSAEAHGTGTGSGSTGRFPLESGPSLSLRGNRASWSPLVQEPVPCVWNRACPLKSSWSLSLGFVLKWQRHTASGLGQLSGFPGNLDRACPLGGIETVPCSPLGACPLGLLFRSSSESDLDGKW